MKKLFLCFVSVVFIGAALFSQETVSGIKISSPNGAPALALALLAQKNPDDFTYVAAEAIAAEFASAKSDFIIAPVNAGAKLFKMGKSSYKLAAVVTWGNLYFASQKKNFKLKDIKKSELTLFGENTINASVALYSLQKHTISAKSIKYLGSAAATQSLLLSDSNAIVLTAEPALSAAKIKNLRITAYSVNELYKKATGFDGYTQAGLFVKSETVEQHPEAVKEFLNRAKDSVAKCSDDVATVASAAVALEILPNVTIAQAAIPQCALRYMSARDAKKQVEATANIDLKQFGGSVPADDFYYGE